MRPLRFALPLLLALTLPVVAAEAPYLNTGQVDLLRLLPPPTPVGSPALRMELQELLDSQASRSPDRAALAIADVDRSVFDMFARLLGERFTPATMPLASKLFHRMGDTEEAVTTPAKAVFGRPRPSIMDPAIKPIGKKSHGNAYPSSHAARVTMAAIILASMLPERRAEIWGRAQEYAESRLWAGMHVLSDVEAGQRAGTVIAALLMNDFAFQSDFGPARVEVRRAMGLEN